MIENCEELLRLERNPRINELSLKLLQNFYERYASAFIWQYTLEAECGLQQEIELRCGKEQFCHLLGIEKIAKRHVSSREIRFFRGQQGWSSIHSGQLDMRSLRALDGQAFRSGKEKFVFFYLLPRILEKPEVVIYDPSKVEPPTNIASSLLFYDAGQSAYVHLGLDTDDAGFYVPRSFFVEKVTDKHDGQRFVGRQVKVTAVKRSQVILAGWRDKNEN